MPLLALANQKTESATSKSWHKHPRLKPLLLRTERRFTSLLQDRHLTAYAENEKVKTNDEMTNHEASEAFSYLKPSGQLVLLLQKSETFPHYPHELSNSIDEKVWQQRMDDLCKALHRYWSWIEKTLFAAAFIISVTVPWPLIAAITRYMQNDDPNEYYGDITVDDGRSSSAAARATASSASSTSSSPSSTIASMANVAATTAARLLRRADDDQSGRSTWTDRDLDYGGYAGNGYWEDSYTPQMRWTAVGVLLGVLVAAWVPWIYVSVRNNRGITRLLKDWNEADEKLGPQRALSWRINKAPPFSNAKLLLIRLPPAAQQAPSAFHPHAYPPSSMYPPSHAYTRRGSLPGYDEESVIDLPKGAIIVDKTSWEPPSMYEPSITPSKKITEIDDDEDEDEVKPTRKSTNIDTATNDWDTFSENSTVRQPSRPKDARDYDTTSVRSHRRGSSAGSIHSLKRQSRVPHRQQTHPLTGQEDDQSGNPQITVTRASKSTSYGSGRSRNSYIEADRDIDGSGRIV